MDGEKKVRNSNNGQHLLKPWFVYISQAFSVIYTVILPPPFNKKGNWDKHLESLPRTVSLQRLSLFYCTVYAVSVSTGHQYFLCLPYVHPLRPGIQKEISRCSHNFLIPRCHKDLANLLLIRVIDDISEQQLNPLTQCPHFTAEMSEVQAGNRTCPEWQQASDEPGARTLFSATSPCWASLPAKEGMGTRDSTSMSQLCSRTWKQSMFIDVKSYTEELLCIPVLQGLFHQSLCCTHAPLGEAPEHCPH